MAFLPELYFSITSDVESKRKLFKRTSVGRDDGCRRIVGGEPMEAVRNPREASLLQAFRRLPPDAAAELTALAERLAAVRADGKIDWSDSWSDEDLEKFTAASAKWLEMEEPKESH